MKIQKLTIHNIASIEDAEIDFESSSLSSSELFLITGKTGSGKSTILDAICLALYASTPRLENTRMQGSVRDLDQEVTVGDPRQLLRKGKGEGYVSLDFIGTNKIPYRAEWIVRRAHGKPDGRLQSKEWSLKDLSTNVIYKKDSEIKPVMASAIGLTFEQFCRTTMLAQGEFTRFLNSDDKDKAAILEKITGVNVYSEIGAAIYALTSEKLALYKDVKLRADSIEIPSDEEVKALEDELQQHVTLQEKLESDRLVLMAKLTWLQQYANVLRLVSEAETAFAVADEQIKTEGYKEDCQLVEDWNASSDARDSYIALRKAEQEKALLVDRILACKEDYRRLKSMCGWEADRLAASMDALDTLQTELDKSSAHSVLYQHEQTASAHLLSLAQAYESIEKETEGLSELSGRLEAAAARKKEKEELYDQAEERFGVADEDLKTAETQLLEYDLPTYRKSSEAQTRRMNGLTAASGAMTTYSQALDAYNETYAQIVAIQQDIAAKQKEFSQKALALEKAEVAKNVAFEICEKQKVGVDEWAKAVRATLAVNDECPVCRHKVEVLPSEDEVDRIYAIAYEAYREALKTFEQIRGSSNQIAAELQAFQKQQAGLQNTLQRNDERVQQSRKALVSALQVIGLSLEEGVDEIVKRLSEETQGKIEELASKIQTGEQMERAVSLKRSALNELRIAKENAFQALDKAKNAERDILQLIAAAEALIADKRIRVTETVAALEDIIGTHDCVDIDWHDAPEAYQKELHILAEQYAALQRRVLESSGNVQIIKSNYDSLIQIAAQIAEEMPEWSDVAAEVKTKLDDSIRKANAILAESRTCKEQVDALSQRIASYETTISEYIAGQESVDHDRLEYLATIPLSRISQVNKSMEDIRTSVVAANSALEEHRKSKALLESSKPQFDEGESKETLEEAMGACADALRSLSENKGAVEQKLKQISENIQKAGTLQDEINDRREEWEKWDRLNAHFGDATGAKFRKIAQSYVLANLIRAANAYMKTLSDRYTLAVEPGEFVILVEDAFQGYARRAVSTISGGESFLVSLSLALALSDIGHTLAVDILFIDEGFGTLSGDPLTNAIGTLKTLHRKSGRKVGIISHVEELKEKVPVQIQVQQEGNSSKSTIKII